MSKETNAPAEQALKFSKAQLMESMKYAKRRDLLTAILEDTKEYTTAEVDSAIKKFMEGQVK